MSEELDPALQSAAARSAAVSVPDHELIRLIGKGSYGEVWLGRSVLGAYRAIKIVHESSFRHRRPFEREFNGVQKFEPVSRLHDGLMDVLQVGRNDLAGYFYCVMELADDVHSGKAIAPEQYAPRTLAHDLAKQKRLPIEECRRIGTGIASALDYLHSHGLIHRDVKPSNIVFVNGIPKLADIGLVAETSEARSYVGTEGFIPPEGPGTVQADLYSFGKVLYEISTGKDRNDYPELPAELGDSVQENELFSFHKVVVKACRADPQQRYRSAKAMWADLVLVVPSGSSAPGRRSTPSKAGVRAVLIILVVISAAFFVASRPTRTARKDQSPSTNTNSNPPSLMRSLVGYWAGEEDGTDSAGANDGLASGGLSFVPGQVGRAFLFNSSKTQVKIEGHPTLDVGAGDGFTLAAWINPADVSIRGPLFEWNNGEGMWGVHFYIDPFCHLHEVRPGTLFANLEDTGHNWNRISSAEGLLVSNVFQHVALTYDKNSGMATLFFNGAVVAQKNLGRFTPSTGYDLYLGRRVSAATRNDIFNFAGLIDEPAVFNRALSSDEIQTIYQAGCAGKALPLPASLPAPSGLVGWWRAENTAGDAAGGNNGVLMHGAEFAAGRVGTSFSFIGATNSYIEVPDAVLLRLTNQLTIEFWVKRQKPFGSDVVVNKGGNWYGTTVNYGVGIAGPTFKNVLQFFFAGGNRSSVSISDLRWHHCAITARDGDVDPVFYVDGVPQPVTQHDGAAKLKLYPSPAPLYIGAQVDPPGGWSYYANALVDELSIYNRVLSPSEMAAIFEAGRAGKVIAVDPAAAR